MNAFQLGKYATINRGITSSLRKVSPIYNGFGAIEGGLYAAGALSPFVGSVGAGLVAAGLVGYGANQIYTGLKEVF